MARTGGQDRPRGQNRAGYVKLAATTSSGGFPGTSGKEPTGQCKRPEFNPWIGKMTWRGNGNPLQYSCLEIPMDRGV